MFEMVPFKKNNISKRGDVFENFLDNFFNDDFFMPMTSQNQGSFKVDLKENENSYLIDADLPGMNKENIDVSLKNNYLTLQAKREDILEDKGDKYVRRERTYGEFSRSFYLDNIDEDNIKASFNDGVLHLDLPKKDKSKNQMKKIDII